MATPCSHEGCQYLASSRCTNAAGKLCPRHQCDCGGHRQRRPPREIKKNVVIRYEKYVLFKLQKSLKPMCRILSAIWHDLDVKPAAMLKYLSQFATYEDAADTDIPYYKYSSRICWIPEKVLADGFSAMTQMRKELARLRRETFTNFDWQTWQCRAPDWMRQDDLAFGVAPPPQPVQADVVDLVEGDGAEGTLGTFITISSAGEESDDDWGDWTAAGSVASTPVPSPSVVRPTAASSSSDQGPLHRRLSAVPTSAPRTPTEGPRKRTLRSPSRGPARRARVKASDLELELTAAEQSLTDFRGPTDPPGRFTWDFLAGHAEPHWRRGYGQSNLQLMQGSPKEWQLKVWIQHFPGVNDARDDAWAVKMLINFVRARTSMWARIQHVEEFADLTAFGIHGTFECGKWVYMHMKDRPHPLSGQAIADGWTLGFHATSLYCVARVMANASLTTGMAKLEVGGQDVQGVFFHIPERAHLCQHSYMVYTVLANGPYMYACIVVLTANTVPLRPDGSKMRYVVKRSSKGTTQNLTYEGDHRILGVLFHVTKVADFLALKRDAFASVEPEFLNDLEFDPAASWDDIQRHSWEKRYYIPGCRGEGVFDARLAGVREQPGEGVAR